MVHRLGDIRLDVSKGRMVASLRLLRSAFPTSPKGLCVDPSGLVRGTSRGPPRTIVVDSQPVGRVLSLAIKAARFGG
eukprot:12923428-Prorocentrum_lima.AAC.1